MKKELNELCYKWDNGEITFCGKKISNYGLENNKVDYNTLSKVVGDMILNNEIINCEVDYWNTESGSIYEEIVTYYDNEYNEITYEEYEKMKTQGLDVTEETEEGDYKDFYQYYIIDGNGADFLSRYTDEVVLYNNRLDVYLWAIDHWGTGWDYVLTEIEIYHDIED